MVVQCRKVYNYMHQLYQPPCALDVTAKKVKYGKQLWTLVHFATPKYNRKW